LYINSIYQIHDYYVYYAFNFIKKRIKYKMINGKGIIAYNESQYMDKNSMNLGMSHNKNNNLFMIVNFGYIDS